MSVNINKLKNLYKKSKQAKTGETYVCPSCCNEFVKKNQSQAFCGSRIDTRCKDFYWNNVIPSKRNNTTRISPANRRNQAEWVHEDDADEALGLDFLLECGCRD